MFDAERIVPRSDASSKRFDPGDSEALWPKDRAFLRKFKGRHHLELRGLMGNRFIHKLRPLVQAQRALQFDSGWLRSWWRSKPLDEAEQPPPSLTLPAIDFIAQFDLSEASVFEWGNRLASGWWSKRCRRITTVDPNIEGIPHIKPLLPSDRDSLPTSFDTSAEIEALLTRQLAVHDVIVIDNNGPWRWQCAEAATKHLADGGMIILDNRDRCLKSSEVLRDTGLTEIDFSGIAPNNAQAHITSIFFPGWLKFRISDRPHPHRRPATAH